MVLALTYQIILPILKREVNLKFIFPQNFNFKNKLLGIIDYPTAIFNIIHFLFVFSISNTFIQNLTAKIFIIIIFCLPLLLLSIIDFNHESILYFLWYIFKYFFRPKIYLYK